jgi:DNA repair ATPase RecN
MFNIKWSAAVPCSGEGGGGVADALRDVQLQVRQLLAQEERLAVQAAADAAAEMEGGGEEAQSRQLEQQRQGAGDDGGGEGEWEDSAAGMLQGAMALLDQAQSVVEGAEERVLQYGQLYRFSQADYDELSARLQQIERLLKQHDATSADELLEAAERQGAALDTYFQMEGQRGQLEAEAQRLLLQVREQAVELSRRRREAAGRLRAALEAVLADLAMAGSRFDVRIAWTSVAAAGAAGGSTSSGSRDGSSIGVPAEQAASCYEDGGQFRVRPSGLDAAEFLFAAGPAEPLRPLSAVASGGESARIMLALKAAPAFMLAAEAGAAAEDGSSEAASSSDSDASAAADGSAAATSAATSSSSTASSTGSSSSQIMVLDEIDSGIGSRLGQPIGRILRRMAGPAGLRVGQILCVSHVPQVGLFFLSVEV